MRFRQLLWKRGKARTKYIEGQSLLAGLMLRGDDCRHELGVEVLHLVNEKRDCFPVFLRRFCNSQDKFLYIHTDVAGVRNTLLRRRPQCHIHAADM